MKAIKSKWVSWKMLKARIKMQRKKERNSKGRTLRYIRILSGELASLQILRNRFLKKSKLYEHFIEMENRKNRKYVLVRKYNICWLSPVSSPPLIHIYVYWAGVNPHETQTWNMNIYVYLLTKIFRIFSYFHLPATF